MLYKATKEFCQSLFVKKKSRAVPFEANRAGVLILHEITLFLLWLVYK